MRRGVTPRGATQEAKEELVGIWEAVVSQKHSDIFMWVHALFGLSWSALNKRRCRARGRKPVTDDEAPGYSQRIKHPMDYSTIKARIQTGCVWGDEAVAPVHAQCETLAPVTRSGKSCRLLRFTNTSASSTTTP
jgi:hypothetical protein